MRTAAGAVALVQRAPPEDPFRWYVRWSDGASGTDGPRTRPCGSLVGVLTALRRVFGVERGAAIRIAHDAGMHAATSAGPVPGDRSNASMPARESGIETRQPGEARLPVPVTVLTGFLGSGKTTLLARLLRHPAMGRTAVIVNEFGEVGLDHDLLATGNESFVRLSTGCLCCQVRSDLLITLAELAARRNTGEAPFERVVVETSGLADPAPMLHALMTDRLAAETYALDGIVATVDAITGLATLDRHPEAVRQAAIADTLLVTKTDLPQADPIVLEARLRHLNPDAPILRVVRGDVAPQTLFGYSRASGSGWSRTPASDADALRISGPAALRASADAHLHTPGIGSFCLVRERPLHAAALALFLSALADNYGEDLLRLKGIVNVAETPGEPAVIHGVQHVYHAPQWLERWPSADTRTRMVFIGRHLRVPWASELLELLEAEVADQSARIPLAGGDTRSA